MTKKDQARAAFIRSQLSAMSRNSWRDARPDDYLPLEAELRALEAKGKKPGPAMLAKLFPGLGGPFGGRK